MDRHIKPEGWDNWRNPTNEQTARFGEYNSSGQGAKADKRVKWSKQLTKKEADLITIETVLGGKDHWDPARTGRARAAGKLGPLPPAATGRAFP